VTFTLTSDDIESHIVVNVSPTLTNTTFDELYDVMLSLLDHFYPERSITVTSIDPDFVTPTIKAQLRKKNRLMHAGRTEEAGALAK